MNITLNDNNYPVYKPKLVLETNSCPKVELLFGHSEYPPLPERIKLASTNTTLSWDSGELDLQVVGFKDNTSDYPLIMTGLILPETLQTWFKGGKERESPLIYQKNEITAPETGAVFFTRLLNDKIVLREGEKTILDDKIFPTSSFATFWRPPKQDNFSWLCHLIEFIRSQAPSIKGWAAFQSDSTPLRLVSMCSGEALELDEQWKPRGQFPTHRYAGQAWAQGYFEIVRLFSLEHPLDLLPELVKIGKQDTDLINNSALGDDKKELVLLPGPVKFYDREYFCRAVTYEFPENAPEFPDVSATLTLTESRQTPKASPLAWQTVACRFQGWEENAKEQKYIKLKLDNGMVANSEGDPDESKFLYAQVLSPTAPREDYHGFYVKYQKDDSMNCLLIPGGLPTVLGSSQLYNKEFEEKADLIIHAEHIAMSSNQVTIEAKEQVSIKGEKVVKMGNKVEVGSD
ncbi:MAG: hypothetical protein DRR08_00955 [Candidatus Parabeggiatoa sp. nov. 2]|nr:MAG: hypothetical protein DRR08_00955 [Gammaproteobacteria bacterium]